MIETNSYFNGSIDKNLNRYQIGLSYNINDLEEDQIDEINLLIMNDLKKLDPFKNITIELLTVFPITIWIYLISISKYVDKNLTIVTPEDITPIITLIDIPNNLLITN
jgi:hypothetical protein